MRIESELGMRVGQGMYYSVTLLSASFSLQRGRSAGRWMGVTLGQTKTRPPSTQRAECFSTHYFPTAWDLMEMAVVDGNGGVRALSESNAAGEAEAAAVVAAAAVANGGVLALI